jgi:hypothetical protein
MICNDQVADTFDKIADLLELQQENPFRIRAYRNAARTLRSMQRQVADILVAGAELPHLPGIGADLASKICDIVETGSTELLYRLRRELPPGLAACDTGVLISIGSDAHGTAELHFLAYGVGQARRGWLGARDVLNSRPLAQLSSLLRHTMV